MSTKVAVSCYCVILCTTYYNTWHNKACSSCSFIVWKPLIMNQLSAHPNFNSISCTLWIRFQIIFHMLIIIILSSLISSSLVFFLSSVNLTEVLSLICYHYFSIKPYTVTIIQHTISFYINISALIYEGNKKNQFHFDSYHYGLKPLAGVADSILVSLRSIMNSLCRNEISHFGFRQKWHLLNCCRSPNTI